MYKVRGCNDERDFCECCGKTRLKRVVWIENLDTGDVRHFGTTCAQQPAKGFDCGKEIKAAVSQAVADEKWSWALAYKAYRAAGGRFNDDGRPADRAEYDRQLAVAKAQITTWRKLAAK